MALRQRTWTWKGKTKSAWIVDYHDAKGKRRLKTFKTKRAADDWRSEARIELKHGTHVADRDSVTVAEAGKLWLATCEANELERSTLQLYRQHLDLHIAPLIGTRKLNELTVPVLRTFQDQLRGSGRSLALTKKVMTYLGGLLADAQDRGLTTRNPVHERRRRAKKKADRHVKRLEIGVDIPTPAEIRAILNAASGFRRAFFMVAALAGLRASELRGLPWRDVDFAAATITVRQRADRWCSIGSPKAAASHRTIPVSPMVISTLKEWKLACPRRATGKTDANGQPVRELQFVFPNGKGNVELLQNIHTRHWRPLQLAAGVAVLNERGTMVPKYTIHALRHFHCSWCAARTQDGGLGLPLKTVQVRMGHGTLAMTADRYGHLFPSQDDADVLAAGEAALMRA